MKKELLRYIAVMDGEDSGAVDALKAIVKRLKGTVFKVEAKEVRGSVKTGVGIDISSAGSRNLVGMLDPCWTLYAKGVAPAEEVKPKPKEPEPEEVPLDDGGEGYGTGDDELESYLSELKERGCSDGEISLMVPSPKKNAKPNAGMESCGYFCFTRGATPTGNPRLPEGGAE